MHNDENTPLSTNGGNKLIHKLFCVQQNIKLSQKCINIYQQTSRLFLILNKQHSFIYQQNIQKRPAKILSNLYQKHLKCCVLKCFSDSEQFLKSFEAPKNCTCKNYKCQEKNQISYCAQTRFQSVSKFEIIIHKFETFCNTYWHITFKIQQRDIIYCYQCFLKRRFDNQNSKQLFNLYAQNLNVETTVCSFTRLNNPFDLNIQYINKSSKLNTILIILIATNYFILLSKLIRVVFQFDRQNFNRIINEQRYGVGQPTLNIDQSITKQSNQSFYARQTTRDV
eukprot:TRINITY_DN6812_c0_g1_i1.p1 TRINITY_DN6812_c0_g1~~TRINITY_DN6812_c0_g1_i1.p1  ORF type:complete len:281 (-),score=-18.78 TRINITY_DN6812_c0_g1_i1:351-1193(-)